MPEGSLEAPVRQAPDLPPVVVSNGFNKFFLGQAAMALASRGRLRLFLTGAYPTPLVERCLGWFGSPPPRKLERLRQRRINLDDGLMVSLPLAEAVGALGVALLNRPWAAALGGALDRAAFRRYGAAAARWMRRRGAGAGIYHYRAGFGQESTAVAKSMGMVTICDHSIAHPAVLEALVAEGGALPDHPSSRPLSPWSRLILDDIERADAVIVNSDFVRRTFEHCGWDPALVHTVHLGVDDAFLRALPDRPAPAPESHTLLFAGSFERRKGADILVAALDRLQGTGWTLEIAGGISTEMARRHEAFLAQPSVRRLGMLERSAYAATLARHRLMVFPSLAEGSARVVMDAMAAGCFVITTPNAGSVVRDGVDGLIVPPGDPDAVADAIRRAWALGAGVEAAGGLAAERVRAGFREVDYGERVIAAYGAILGSGYGANGAARRGRQEKPGHGLGEGR